MRTPDLVIDFIRPPRAMASVCLTVIAVLRARAPVNNKQE
jgi:hypothetical protein